MGSHARRQASRSTAATEREGKDLHLIAIVDYGMGNVRSVRNALEALGEDAVITDDPAVLRDADRLILPGVGAFGDAMRNLADRALVDVLHQEVISAHKPFLGICLGMELLARSTTEHGRHEGLGWIDAEVVRFDLAKSRDLKIPHMGWNEVTPVVRHPVLAGLKPDEFTFYFVHSYYVTCRARTDVAATCDYGQTFDAVIAHDNIFATQFHPEKSQDSGLQILRNFAQWRP